jgi:cytochrome c oxidase subunit 4
MRRLLLTWVGLLLLLEMTIAASFLPIGNWRQLANMAIAMAKAGLILWIFMKMREETALVRLAGVLAAVLLLVLGSLLASDYFFRIDTPLIQIDGSKARAALTPPSTSYGERSAFDLRGGDPRPTHVDA